MVGVYKSLTDFLPMLEEDKIGDWAIDCVNDGIPEHPIQMSFVNYSRLIREVEDAIYNFEQMPPEYGLNRYSSILEANGIEWGMDSMSAKDVSVLDGKCVMAMVYSLFSAQRPWAEIVKHLKQVNMILIIHRILMSEKFYAILNPVSRGGFPPGLWTPSADVGSPPLRNKRVPFHEKGDKRNMRRNKKTL